MCRANLRTEDSQNIQKSLLRILFGVEEEWLPSCSLVSCTGLSTAMPLVGREEIFLTGESKSSSSSPLGRYAGSLSESYGDEKADKRVHVISSQIAISI